MIRTSDPISQTKFCNAIATIASLVSIGSARAPRRADGENLLRLLKPKTTQTLVIPGHDFADEISLKTSDIPKAAAAAAAAAEEISQLRIASFSSYLITLSKLLNGGVIGSAGHFLYKRNK